MFRLLARGLDQPRDRRQLVVGENTVKTHVARILTKLDLRDRVQAVVLAYETGLIPGAATAVSREAQRRRANTSPLASARRFEATMLSHIATSTSDVGCRALMLHN